MTLFMVVTEIDPKPGVEEGTIDTVTTTVEGTIDIVITTVEVKVVISEVDAKVVAKVVEEDFLVAQASRDVGDLKVIVIKTLLQTINSGMFPGKFD